MASSAAWFANGEEETHSDKRKEMKLSQISLDGYTSLLFKAPYGFGKTIAAASFARLGPVYLSYWDKKAPVELNQFFKQHAPDLLDNIEYDVYGANNANEYLNKMLQLSRDCRYVACINDSVTNMTSAAVNWSLGFNDDKKGNKKVGIQKPDWDEYKVETSLVTQALDICRTLPCHIIWTCHPIPGTRVEGSGSSMRVSKVNSIVTYGSKVAGIVPGQFSEIYHFSKLSDWDASAGKAKIRYVVSTEQVGDDYAKSNLGLNCEMDITGKLFYDVWKAEIKKLEERLNGIEIKPSNPFANMTNLSTTAQEQKKPWEK
jgi:hypothetical protein